MPTQKNIKPPEKLYEYFEQYKVDCKNSPKKENFYSSRADKQVSVDREIPLTWDGFEIWLRKKGIITRLDHYKSNLDNNYSEYLYIIRAIDKEIYEDKFSGAAAGIFQHNIIARDLGLIDKKDIDGKITGAVVLKFDKELQDGILYLTGGSDKQTKENTDTA